MPDPYVGGPTVPGAGCAYATDIDVPACGAPAVVHLMVEAPGWGRVLLDGCEAHAPIARRCGKVLAEHPYGEFCPQGTCWTLVGGWVQP